MKRILLAFFMLFVPFAANSADFVVNSKEDLMKQRLPFNMDVFKSLMPTLQIAKWKDSKHDYEYANLKEDSDEYNLIIEYLYNSLGQNRYKVPFSAKDLLDVCLEIHKKEIVLIMNCGDFVLNYTKAIAEKRGFLRIPCKEQKILDDNTEAEQQWTRMYLGNYHPQYLYASEEKMNQGIAYVCDPNRVYNGCYEDDTVTLGKGSRRQGIVNRDSIHVKYWCTRSSEDGLGAWVAIYY